MARSADVRFPPKADIRPVARLSSNLRVRDGATKRANDVCNKAPTVFDKNGVSANKCTDLADIAFLVKGLLKRPYCEIHPILARKQAIMASASAVLQDVDCIPEIQKALRKIIQAVRPKVLVEHSEWLRPTNALLKERFENRDGAGCQDGGSHCHHPCSVDEFGRAALIQACQVLGFGSLVPSDAVLGGKRNKVDVVKHGA